MAGDPDILVPLTSARTEFEAQTMAAALEADGIRAKVFATSANMLQWEGGYTDPIKVMVRRADLERAAASLKRTRKESVDIDWSEVDVGPGEGEGYPVCPACGADREGLQPAEACHECGFRAVPVPRRYKPSGTRRFIRRAGFILLGAAMIVTVFSREIAIPALIVAVLMIFWESGVEVQHSESALPRRRREN
jgi:hypothetical protein